MNRPSCNVHIVVLDVKIVKYNFQIEGFDAAVFRMTYLLVGRIFRHNLVLARLRPAGVNGLEPRFEGRCPTRHGATLRNNRRWWQTCNAPFSLRLVWIEAEIGAKGRFRMKTKLALGAYLDRKS